MDASMMTELSKFCSNGDLTIQQVQPKGGATGGMTWWADRFTKL